jgi:ubiquinone/menaquinone biosynthesis C-methylase UbiE
MTIASTDARFAGSIPALYEQYLGPLKFEPYAEDLAARLRELARGTVLEIAAGTGIVTRALARVLPRAVRIVATDLNEGMLGVARERLRDERVEWKQADAQLLPFGDSEFQGVVCQFGIMFVPDRHAAYSEARRVLVPDGLYVFNTWGPLAANEVSLIAGETVAAMFPEAPPRFIERVPFGYHDPTVIRAELQHAGFARIEIDTVDKVSRATAEDAATGLCMGTPLRSEIEKRDPARLAEARDKTTEALMRRYGHAPFDCAMRAYVITARR